jgi:hypothetical protein
MQQQACAGLGRLPFSWPATTAQSPQMGNVQTGPVSGAFKFAARAHRQDGGLNSARRRQLGRTADRWDHQGMTLPLTRQSKRPFTLPSK